MGECANKDNEPMALRIINGEQLEMSELDRGTKSERVRFSLGINRLLMVTLEKPRSVDANHPHVFLGTT